MTSFMNFNWIEYFIYIMKPKLNSFNGLSTAWNLDSFDGTSEFVSKSWKTYIILFHQRLKYILNA